MDRVENEIYACLYKRVSGHYKHIADTFQGGHEFEIQADTGGPRTQILLPVSRPESSLFLKKCSLYEFL